MLTLKSMPLPVVPPFFVMPYNAAPASVSDPLGHWPSVGAPVKACRLE